MTPYANCFIGTYTQRRNILVYTRIRTFEDLVFSVISFPLCHVPAFLSAAKARQTMEQSMFLLARGILLSLIFFQDGENFIEFFYNIDAANFFCHF